MGILARFFGHEGTVRFEGETVEGQKFSGKVKIECIGLDRADLEKELKKVLLVETGKKANSLSIVALT